MNFSNMGQPAYNEVVREFGNEILDSWRAMDRAKLGAIVFADSAKRARLNQILHPPHSGRGLEVVRRARQARRPRNGICGSRSDHRS